MKQRDIRKKEAVHFILLLGCISLFADMTYEGARSINGPYLQVLGASGTVVGVTAGAGEFVGYALRLFSGYISDRSRKYWLILFTGYALNLFSVPLLAWAGYWQVAVLLIIAERAGKAIRNPTRDAMLSYASGVVGQGWGFGLHQFMDQLGATIGPLLISIVLFYKQDHYKDAYLMLFIPAACALTILYIARRSYSEPHILAIKTVRLQQAEAYPSGFFIYAVSAMLIATGYADYPLIAYHFKQQQLIQDSWIPALYSLAMLTEGVTSLLLGRLYDKAGAWTLVATTVLSMFFAPLVFLLNIQWAIAGLVLWGIGMGAQGSIMKALVSELIPASKRASAFGLFDTLFGIAWFAGSAFMGYLYDKSVMNLVVFSMDMHFIAIIVLTIYLRGLRKQTS